MAVADQIQMQLDELDTRLDRLRATYEQYFVGIERIEPLVQRKDVERRFHDLRKMQLRNTAARFRFQSLVQKYTTYISHWQRICRRIEEGTYKRDLQRAQRYGKQLAGQDADHVQELEVDAIEDASVDVEYDDDQPTVPPPPQSVAAPVIAPPRSPPPSSVHTGRGMSEEMPFDDAADPTPRPAPTPVRPVIAPRAAVPSPPSAPAAPAQPVPARPNPVLAAPVIPAPAAAAPAPPAPAATTPIAPARPVPPPPAMGAPAGGARRVGFSPFGGAIPGAARGGASGNPSLKPPATAPTPEAPVPAAPPTQPASPVVTAARPAPAATAPAAAAPARTPAAPPEDAGLRALYERYRDTRQKNGEPAVPFETVARQVRDSLPRLNEKYPGQQVTLDVGVKDGKTVLKPVVGPKK